MPGASLSSTGRGDGEGTADVEELESTKKEGQDDSDPFKPDTTTSSGTSDKLSRQSERGESDFSIEDYFSFSDYEGEDESE